MTVQGQADVCRVCLSDEMAKENKGLSLFQKLQDSLIYEHIVSICNVDITEDDGLPSIICTDCLIELETAVNFKIKCQTSNTILHSKKVENSDDCGVNFDFNPNNIKEEKLEDNLENPLQMDHLVEYCFNENKEDSDVVLKTEENEEDTDDILKTEENGEADDILKTEENGEADDILKTEESREDTDDILKTEESREDTDDILKTEENEEDTDDILKTEENGEDTDDILKTEESREDTDDILKTEKKAEDADDVLKTEERPSKAIDLKLICDDCGGSFPSKCKLRVHWKKVHMPEALICRICKRAFKSFKAYNQHIKHKPKRCLAMKNVHVKGTGKSRLYICKDCPYTSKINEHMQCHILLHSGEKPFKCLSCDKWFTQRNAMHSHMERAHKVYKVEITCQYCGKFVRGRDAVYKHLKIHAAASVECDVCKKVFKNKSSLKAHMVRHTGVKKYTCEKCAKRFFTIAELCNHRRQKHSKLEIWYKCDLCEYKAHKASTIKKHNAKHTANNIACNKCGVFFDSPEKLALHQLRHSESEKKFQCPHCDKRYFTKDYAQRHIRAKHTCALSDSQPILVKNEENSDNEDKKTSRKHKKRSKKT